LLVQQASRPGWAQVVASTSTSAQTRKPPGKIATHFEPGHCASALQSPAPVGAPPAPLLLAPLVPDAVVELPAPPADAVVALDPPLPVEAVALASPVVVEVVVEVVPPEPVGPTELPQPAHVSTVRVVQVKNRITVSSGHRRADPPEIQADRHRQGCGWPFLADALGVI
jgi:hypothetical protein